MDTSNFKEVFTSDEVKKLRAENEMLYYEAQRLDSLATDFAKRTEYWIGRCDSWQNDCEQLRQRVAELEAAVKKSNDRLNEERDIWDRMFGDGERKLERIEIELDDCLHVLEALWMKQNTPELTDLWAKILIRNKRATGASSAEDTCHPTTE